MVVAAFHAVDVGQWNVGKNGWLHVFPIHLLTFQPCHAPPCPSTSGRDGPSSLDAVVPRLLETLSCFIPFSFLPLPPCTLTSTHCVQTARRQTPRPCTNVGPCPNQLARLVHCMLHYLHVPHPRPVRYRCGITSGVSIEPGPGPGPRLVWGRAFFIRLRHPPTRLGCEEC